jgi:homoserine kinase
VNGVNGLAVRVPATSANLGPGFDALGVAVELHLRVALVERGEQRVITRGEGAGELATDESNLIWRVLTAWLDHAGQPAPDVSLRVDNAIPLERGLGSSAAAAVAGAVLGRALSNSGSDDDVIAAAAELEGHRDNAAAAALGGVVLCQGTTTTRLEPTAALRPVLCVPKGRQATDAARRLLPEQVPVTDAAANGARTAAVLAGLAGVIAWQPAAMRDVLHEPARFAAMPETGRLVTALREAGVGAALSGAGPAVLAVVTAGDPGATEQVRAAAGDGWRVVASAWDLAGAMVSAVQRPLGKVKGTDTTSQRNP